MMENAKAALAVESLDVRAGGQEDGRDAPLTQVGTIGELDPALASPTNDNRASADPTEPGVALAVRKGILECDFDPLRVKSKGKRPTVTNWTKGDPAVLTFQPGFANTGMAAAGLRVIDFDIEDQQDHGRARDAEDLIVRRLGPGALVRRRANSARFQMVYRAQQGAPRKLERGFDGGRIEVLGTGQQTVVHGLHETGVPLVWDDERSPWTVHRDEVAAVSEADLAAALDALVEVLGATPHKAGQTRGNPAPANDAGASDLDDGLFNISCLGLFDKLTDGGKSLLVSRLLAMVPHSYVGKGNYGQWRNILWSALATGAPDVRQIIHERCSLWPNYDGEEAVDRVLNSFGHKEGMITAGTLIDVARAADPAGFQRALSEAKAMSSADSRPQVPVRGSLELDELMREILYGSQIKTQPVDMAELEGTTPPEIDWVIRDMLPRGTAALFTGKGGVGKSTAALQMAECMRRGLPFLGHETVGRTTLIYSCEDDLNELHRRHARIGQGLALYSEDGLPEPVGRLHVWPRVGQFNDLVKHNLQTGSLDLTEAFGELAKEAIEKGVDLIIIDTAAQTFIGSENDRTIVTKYVNVMSRLAQICNACVLILAHPPKNDAEYSGSTGWDGTVRTRMLLYREEKEGRQHYHFKIAKANYAPEYDKEIHRDASGILFAPDALPAQLEAERRALEDLTAPKRIFLMLLDTFIAQQRNVSHKDRAGNYAPREFASDPRAEGITKQRFAKAMDELFCEGVLVGDAPLPWKKNRSIVYGLARRAAADAEHDWHPDAA